MPITRALITGANGFVGKHLSKGLVHRGIEVIEGSGEDHTSKSLDVTRLDQLLSIDEKIEAVIHLAAKTYVGKSIHNPHQTYDTNILGTLNLLEFCRLKNVGKFINLSTYVYGQPQYLPVDENHPIDPSSPYHRSKVIAEQLCQYYADDFGVNVVTLRPFYLYGPSPKPDSLIYSVIEQIKKERGKVILSGESTRRDFLFVEDFVSLVERILDKFPQGYNVYNVGFGRSYTLKEVSQHLARIMNKKISISYDSEIRPNDIINSVADISKVSKEFNWKPSTELEVGLELSVNESGN